MEWLRPRNYRSQLCLSIPLKGSGIRLGGREKATIVACLLGDRGTYSVKIAHKPRPFLDPSQQLGALVAM